MTMLKSFKYHAPTTLKAALGLLEKSRSPLLLAGGTFVLNTLKKTNHAPSDVIGLKKVDVLQGIKDTKKGLSIGAMVTISELIESDLVCKNFASLREACEKLGTTPIRNMATIGGNIASRFYWADLPTLLLSLDARLVCATSKSTKTISLEAFLEQKQKSKFILTTILLPKEERRGFYFRHTKAMDVDTPMLALAVSYCIKGSGLKDVRLFVNTSLSEPICLKETAGFFEHADIKTLTPAGWKASFEKDIKDSKLDPFRVMLLEVDLNKLIAILKETAKK